jgi:hypothetical protein
VICPKRKFGFHSQEKQSFVSFFVFLSDFTIFSSVSLSKQFAVFSLFERVLISWSLAIDERSEYKDLRSSSRLSVISYVHERTELY